MLDRAERVEYANWRISMMQSGAGCNIDELVKWVDESYDVDSTRFEAKQGQGQPPQPGAPGQPPQGGAPAAPKVQPGKMFAPGNQLNPQTVLGQ